MKDPSSWKMCCFWCVHPKLYFWLLAFCGSVGLDRWSWYMHAKVLSHNPLRHILFIVSAGTSLNLHIYDRIVESISLAHLPELSA